MAQHYIGKYKIMINQQYANIRDYIYADMGVHDDTAVIQTCVTNFRKIYFPTGIYYYNGILLLPSNTTIIGDGGMLSELRSVDTTQRGFLYSGNQANITIQGMYLNGNINRIAGGATGSSTYEIDNDLTYEPRHNNVN